jgi:uncharacterized protein YbaP (TraB family)
VTRALALAAALALAGCEAPGEDWPPPSPALWQVSDAGGVRGWLFGTIHALPDGAEWQTPALDAALDDAGVLVVEIAALGDAATAGAAFDRLAHSPGLPPLTRRVAAAERAALAAALARAGLDEADFATTESWAAALEIAAAARDGEAGNGADRALLTRGLPTIGLESHAEQFAIFDRLNPQDQAVLLAETARGAGRASTGRELAEAWLAGDLATIEAESARGFLADPELRQALLTGRNQAWAGRIAGLLAGGRQPFVAVGAAHMLGDQGLPALLAARGYTVQRIQ